MGYLEVKQEERRRESPAGFHCYNLYRTNPAEWYFKYILGLRPVKTKPALLRGGAMHDALEAYYKNGCHVEMAIQAYQHAIADRSSEYAEPQKQLDDLNYGPPMLRTFHEKIGQFDKEKYEILETEHQYEVPIGPPGQELIFTVRPDRVFRSRITRVVTPMESKTTGFSLDGMFRKTERGDQVTSYIWALRKRRPEWNVEGCQIDVLYNRQSVFDAKRPGFAYRTKYELQMFELGLYGTIIEVTQKVLALKTVPWPILFPIVKEAEFESDYQLLFGNPIKPDDVPPGFVKDDWAKEMDSVMKITQSFTLDSAKGGIK